MKPARGRRGLRPGLPASQGQALPSRPHGPTVSDWTSPAALQRAYLFLVQTGKRRPRGRTQSCLPRRPPESPLFSGHGRTRRLGPRPQSGAGRGPGRSVRSKGVGSRIGSCGDTEGAACCSLSFLPLVSKPGHPQGLPACHAPPFPGICVLPRAPPPAGEGSLEPGVRPGEAGPAGASGPHSASSRRGSEAVPGLRGSLPCLHLPHSGPRAARQAPYKQDTTRRGVQWWERDGEPR